MKIKKRLSLWLAVLLVISLLTGCAGKSADMEGNDSAKPMAPGEAFDDLITGDSVTGSWNDVNESAVDSQKKIRNLEMHAETEALDTLLQNIEARVKELGGYVEQQEVYRGSAYAKYVYRHANLTVRIPAEKADSFVEKVGEISNITSTTENVDDVTLQYVATESRITALTTEETRLLELLAKAENMEDLLLIEARLTDVRTELEEYTSQLRLYDNLVNYATIRLYVEEVREYTPVKEKTLWQRIGGGLSDNLRDLGEGAEDFLVFIITSLPYFVLIAGVLAVFFLGFKAAMRKRKQKKQKQDPSV